MIKAKGTKREEEAMPETQRIPRGNKITHWAANQQLNALQNPQTRRRERDRGRAEGERNGAKTGSIPEEEGRKK